MIYIIQARKSAEKKISQSLKNQSSLEKIGLLEYALKIRILGSYVMGSQTEKCITILKHRKHLDQNL